MAGCGMRRKTWVGPTVVAVLALALLAGCGLSTTGARDRDADPGTESAPVPHLAEVTPLEDVRDWEGVTTPAARTPVDPVAESPEPELPVTVTDSQGTEVTVEDVSRVLALDVYGTLSRTVFELGLGDRLVGRDISTSFDEASDLPLVTQGGHNLNAESILGLDPTVILTDTSLGPWDVILQMRDAGIPVIVMDPHRDLTAIPELVRATAQALGVVAEGELLAERTETAVQAKLSEIASIAPQDPSEKLRMVFLYVRGQSGVYYMFGAGSGSDALITALGGADVASEIGMDGMRPLNDEGLVKAAPDVILLMTHGLDSVGGVDGLLEKLPAVADTPAGQKRRIIDMADAEILSFGPNTAEVLDALAVAVYAQDAS